MKDKKYIPQPADLSDVTLPDGLLELREQIAKNAHEVWAQNRMNEGWTYGAVRNDAMKQHPDLVPYEDLTEGEREYDRATAMNSIKLLLKLGYKITKE
ncbi:MAG: Ryanodine receptor Ryr [Bacteroidaceae bacterium]|nr:Ryanodine receptor Ryr [Bacteroidaceae bacterium]